MLGGLAAYASILVLATTAIHRNWLEVTRDAEALWYMNRASFLHSCRSALAPLGLGERKGSWLHVLAPSSNAAFQDVGATDEIPGRPLGGAVAVAERQSPPTLTPEGQHLLAALAKANDAAWEVRRKGVVLFALGFCRIGS